MGKIYSSAKEVLLWLGGGNSETGRAFRFMEAEEDLTKLDSLFSLLEQPYFQRVWVFQELTPNENVVMACGDDPADFKDFRLCVFALWKFFEGCDDYDAESDAVRDLYSAARMLFIRSEYQNRGAVRYQILLEAINPQTQSPNQPKH